MRTVSVREAREKISQLLDAAAQGEDIAITRRGKVIAKLIGSGERAPFPDRSSFRASLPMARTSAADIVRMMRDEERS
ncbi:MAG: type II toxin-antitoxin system prevent-host-death family antitoxin [Burkholderiales bacterium]|nr:type II toxin-antitoxin system prevent-host-death family antitoxin [Burkholderiales bacterium]